MPEPKRPLKVFLCHAHADRDAVRALYNRLVKDGVDAWFDKEKLLPGQDWRLEIENAVHESDVVIVCLSKLFNLEGFRQREVRWALDKAMDKPERDIFIIPARLEECESLESLSKWHEVNLFENDGYERLMRALRMRAEKIGAQLETKNKRIKPSEQHFSFKEAINKFIADTRNLLRNSYPLLRVLGILFGVGMIIWGGSLFLPDMLPRASTAQPSPTVMPTFTATRVLPTHTPAYTSTPSVTTTFTKTLTPTPSKPFEYVVQEGDYLAVIVAKFDLGGDGVDLILSLNPYTSEGANHSIDPGMQIVYPGQKIMLPNHGMQLPTATLIPAGLPAGTKVDYYVRAGDTLALIAAKFNTTPDAIIKENNLNNVGTIYVGQKLIIPINLVTTTASPPPTSTSIP